MSQSTESDPILEVRDVRVDFGAIHALTGLSLRVQRHAVCGVIGPNGAGKSTLMKVLAGLVEPSAGELRIDGQSVPFGHRYRVARLGVHLVPQETSLVDALSVEANINLGNELRRGPFVRTRDARARARHALGLLGMDLEPARLVHTLSLPEKRLVMVAKALATDLRVLILDEPTAALTVDEATQLLRAVTRLRDQGVTTILITHRLDEVISVCDEVFGVRDGRVGGHWTNWGQRATVADLVAFVTGTSEIVSESSGAEELARPPSVLLAIDDVSADDLRPTTLQVSSGEIVGVVGRPGSGAEQLLDILGGVVPLPSGTVRVRDRPVDLRSPADAIKAGIGYLSADRTRLALPTASVAKNISLSSLRSVATGGIIVRRRRELDLVKRHLPPGLESRTEDAFATLSGGNRQRVLVARLIAAGADVLVLSNPTAGVDVAGRQRFRGDIARLARAGRGIILFTSEPEELLGLADRVLVFDNGVIRQVLAGTALTESNLLSAAMVVADA